ncbi:MAG: hypothetical protein WC975_10650 [Phycisphaerae bacterium]
MTRFTSRMSKWILMSILFLSMIAGGCEGDWVATTLTSTTSTLGSTVGAALGTAIASAILGTPPV